MINMYQLTLLSAFFLVFSSCDIFEIHLTPAKLINTFYFPEQELFQTCPKHFIYALDSSGSMSGVSWNIVKKFLEKQEPLPLGSIVSSFKYSSGLTMPRLHSEGNKKIFGRSLGIPEGKATYLKALNKIKNILNLYTNPPEEFTINLISDGYDKYAPEEQALLSLLKTHKKGECKRFINCIQTKKYDIQSNFEKLCNRLGITVTFLQDGQVPFLSIDGLLNEK